MTVEQRSIPVPGWLTNSWPVILTIIAMVSGYANLKNTVEGNTKDISQLQTDLKQSEKDRLESLEGVRNSLGVVQLNLARICEKLHVSCKE